MKKARMIFLTGLLTLCTFALAMAQNAPADRVNVPLSDPSRPVMLKVGLISGSITVKGAAVKEVTVEARVRSTEDEEEKSDKPRGLKVIPNNNTGLTVEEDDNVLLFGSLVAGFKSLELEAFDVLANFFQVGSARPQIKLEDEPGGHLHERSRHGRD